jgi:hypothetical protein
MLCTLDSILTKRVENDDEKQEPQVERRESLGPTQWRRMMSSLEEAMPTVVEEPVVPTEPTKSESLMSKRYCEKVMLLIREELERPEGWSRARHFVHKKFAENERKKSIMKSMFDIETPEEIEKRRIERQKAAEIALKHRQKKHDHDHKGAGDGKRSGELELNRKEFDHKQRGLTGKRFGDGDDEDFDGVAKKKRGSDEEDDDTDGKKAGAANKRIRNEEEGEDKFGARKKKVDPRCVQCVCVARVRM